MAQTARRTTRTSALLAALFIASGPASAQLEIGGQPFDSSTSSAGSETNLTQMIQRDLVVLGYDPGSISGEMDVTTAVAISKFQAENNIAVTGEASPQLAGILSARVGALRNGTAQGPAAANSATPSLDGTAGSESGSDCLREVADDTADTSRKLGRLFGRLGGRGSQQEIAEAAADAADVVEAVGDFSDCQPEN